MSATKAIYDEGYRALIHALTEQRKRAKITQEQLSELTGIPRYDISKVERFVRELRINELDLWLSATGIAQSLIEDLMRKADRKHC